MTVNRSGISSYRPCLISIFTVFLWRWRASLAIKLRPVLWWQCKPRLHDLQPQNRKSEWCFIYAPVWYMTMNSGARVELACFRLWAWWLPKRPAHIKSRKKGLNLQPAAYRAAALPLSYSGIEAIPEGCGSLCLSHVWPHTQLPSFTPGLWCRLFIASKNIIHQSI